MLALWLNWALGIPGSFTSGRSQPQRREGRGWLSSLRNCLAPQVVREIWPTSVILDLQEEGFLGSLPQAWSTP